MYPKLSQHFLSREPSDIRKAQIEFMKRTDSVQAINTAIWNVSLPMHPAMQERMFDLQNPNSPFQDGVVKYTATVGTQEANEAVLNIIASSGYNTKWLYSQITDWWSQAMELVLIGVCWPAGTDIDPLLLIDAAYTNYNAFAQRVGRKTISIRRNLQDSWKFSLPEMTQIEKIILEKKPSAIVVIPYDNPTGHFYDHDSMLKIAQLCVKYNMWMISDEAYRELHYTDQSASSIRALNESDVPWITGRRISIETSSKVRNACGLRIWALVTDNLDFHTKSVAENTAWLCSNTIWQYIFWALAHQSHQDLQKRYNTQRKYYFDMMQNLTIKLRESLPWIIVSSPDASIYSVVDVKNIAKPGFDSLDFVLFCSQRWKVSIDNQDYTLLVSPMAGFYTVDKWEYNPGKTQMRIAYVETPQKMDLVPDLFAQLFQEYENSR
jgi:aspartate aminotransferase